MITMVSSLQVFLLSILTNSGFSDCEDRFQGIACVGIASQAFPN